MAKAEQVTAPARVSAAPWRFSSYGLPDIESVIDTSDEMSQVRPLLEKVREAIEEAASLGHYYAEVPVDVNPKTDLGANGQITASRARVIIESHGYAAAVVQPPLKSATDTAETSGKLTVTWGDGDWRKRDDSGRLRL
jgi:hypothetical protein